MWGTDGVRVFTVDDGWGWIFTAIEHWNAECVSWHVCNEATASSPSAESPWGVARLYASTSAGAARGLALRMDHGSQYLSDHFTNQIKFWGIQVGPTPSSNSPRPTASPRGSIARSEQIIHGRATSRSCGTPSAGSSNRGDAQWIVEKNGYLSPAQAVRRGHRDVTQARRMRQTCVQGTGCDTPFSCSMVDSDRAIGQRDSSALPKPNPSLSMPDANT